jgi:hypothetical protein
LRKSLDAILTFLKIESLRPTRIDIVEKLQAPHILYLPLEVVVLESSDRPGGRMEKGSFWL